MQYITVGVFFLVVTAVLANYLTLACLGFMICWSAFIMLIGLIKEIKGGR